MINQGRLQELQKLLEQEKEELLAVVERLTGPGGLETPADEADRELSAYDNHPADYGSQMYERSKDLGLLQAARKQLAEVAEAQEAIRKGSYGICQSCGQPIPEERLLALPRTVLCVQCKKERETEEQTARPVEEEALRRPPEAGLRGRLDYAFDRDAAWEEVAEVGTSSSRQGIPSQIQNNIGRE